MGEKGISQCGGCRKPKKTSLYACSEPQLATILRVGARDEKEGFDVSSTKRYTFNFNLSPSDFEATFS